MLAAGADRLRRRRARAGSVRARRRPRRGAHGATAPALIDDDTPTPAHARFAARAPGARARRRASALWACAIGALVAAVRLATATLTQMGWFFTKAALLTFGGAYAVLPYVYQGAVEQLPAG